MSSDGFHVHGPHDHAIEHATQGHGDHGSEDQGGVSTNRVAMFTAVVATVGAIFAYMGGATQANAGLAKANASNQWNYFQAKSTKQSLAELSRDLAPEDKKAKYQEKIERYESEKKGIQKEAETADKESAEQMHQHHRWAQATTVLQVSIAFAAIALLTRRKWLERAMYGVAFAGVVIGALAAAHI